jgi:hypothetical protein
MITTYQMDVNELSVEVINSIKAAFKNKTINITVSEAMDETDYLLSSPANKAHLQRSITELEEGKGVVFTIEELQKKFGNNEVNNL